MKLNHFIWWLNYSINFSASVISFDHWNLLILASQHNYFDYIINTSTIYHLLSATYNKKLYAFWNLSPLISNSNSPLQIIFYDIWFSTRKNDFPPIKLNQAINDYLSTTAKLRNQIDRKSSVLIMKYYYWTEIVIDRFLCPTKDNCPVIT